MYKNNRIEDMKVILELEVVESSIRLELIKAYPLFRTIVLLCLLGLILMSIFNYYNLIN